MFKKVGLLFLIFLLCGLSGCGQAVSAPGQTAQLTDISSLEAESVSMIQNIQETETLLGDEVPVMIDEVLAAYAGDVGAGSCANVGIVVRNTDYVFFQISYSEQMAQYTNRNKIYAHSLQRDEDILVYDTSDAYWINEMRANDTHLYWVEYLSEDPNARYRIMQYQLDNGELSCIAENDGTEYSEISSMLSERFFVWYEVPMNGPYQIFVFDIEKQEIRERDVLSAVPGHTMTLYPAFSYLWIVEDCITYFTQDEQEQIYIQREDLPTGQIECFLLGEADPYRKVCGCFSDGRYVGWHFQYELRQFYFYDTVQQKLYHWDMKKDGMYSFSEFLCDGRFYFNNTEDKKVYVWDLPTGQVYCQHLDDGFWFRQYGENKFYLGTSSFDCKSVLPICTDAP